MGSENWLGAELAGYRLDALIGRGGMGLVYRATHLRLGRLAALKLLPETLATDAEYRRRFEREARLAASLEHAHIIPIYDAGYTEGVLYLAMRFVDGVDLGAVIGEEQPMDVDQVCDLLGPVADALDAAHRAGLVHRDVKPANILVAPATRYGQPQRAYLCDFGIAKQAVNTGEPLTVAGQFLGTLQYSAPEQIQGGLIDGRADQYALGCVAFHCLVGQVPFPGEQPAALMFAHLSAPVPQLSSHRPELGAGVDDVIGQALAKQPHERFADCNAFIQALRTAGREPASTTAQPAQSGPQPPTDSTVNPPDDTGSQETLRRVGAFPDQAPTPEVEALYDEALAAFWTGRWDQAVELLQHVLTHHPDHPAAVIKLEQARRGQQLAASHGQQAPTGIEGQVTGAPLAPPDRRVLPTLPEPSSPAASPAVPHPIALQILRHRKMVNSVAFSPDGRWLATASSDKTARIWDTTSGAELLSVSHPDWCHEIRDVAFSPDGRRLATASSDHTARIWDAGNGQPLITVTHLDAVVRVVFGPDGRRLATASSDHTARIWDAGNGQPLITVTHLDAVVGVAFSPDGHQLATASIDKTARVWGVRSGHRLATISHHDWVLGVAFSPDGRRLATINLDGTAWIWDIAGNGQHLATITHNDSVRAVTFSPDGRRLATASSDHTARIWDAGNGRQLTRFTHHGRVLGVAFSPGGRWLATASEDLTARIWMLNDDE